MVLVVQMGSDILSCSDFDWLKRGLFWNGQRHSKSEHFGPILEWFLEIHTKKHKLALKNPEF